MPRISALTTRCAAVLLALLPLSAAQAGIEIVIPEATEQLQNNIRAFLSLTRYAERDDVTPETMSRLQRRIVSETRAALEPLGYYEPEVKYETVQEGDDWRVTIHVKPGRPVRLSEVSVTVTGPGEQERAIQEVVELQEPSVSFVFLRHDWPASARLRPSGLDCSRKWKRKLSSSQVASASLP